MSIEEPLEAFCSITHTAFPKASPDGEWVACARDATGRFELHAIHVETGERRQLTNGELPADPQGFGFRWNADSDAIIFQDTRNVVADPDQPDGPTRVLRAALDGTVEHLFTVDEWVVPWAVNPETGYLYYRAGEETLRWRDLETGDDGEFPRFPGLLAPATCVVSPDGEWVAYSSSPPDADLTELTTYLARADGSDPRRVNPPDAGQHFVPSAWHPDCERLLVTTTDGLPTAGQRFGIYDRSSDAAEWIGESHAEAFLDGGDRILTGGWPPEQSLAIYDLQGNRTDVDCDGLIHLCNGTEAVVGDTGFVVQRSEEGPREVALHDVATGDTRVLFGHGPDRRVFDPDSKVDPVEVTFPLPDGEEVPGLLVRPPDATDEPTPAVVIFYGGTESPSGGGALGAPIFAHLGYTAFLPGCPVENWTNAEHECLAAAGRWTARQDGVDGTRVAVHGHSHGGYNVYMQAVRYPEVWDAFVADTGMVDLHAEVRHNPGGNLQWHLGDPDENADQYRAQSPIQHVDGEVGSPLLMIHGEDDWMADQPELFVDALEERGWTEGEEYEYVVLDGVGHSGKARDHKLRRGRAIIEFLDRRL